MFNKNGKENLASKILRNPEINNVDALKQFDNFLNSVGGIYKLTEANRNKLLELAKDYSRFEVVARFAQILDVKKDRELLKDILAYVAFRRDDLKSQGNSNKAISNYIEKVIGQLKSYFLAISDRVKLTEKEMAEINVKVLLQRITNPEARATLYEEYLLDDTKVEELRELHRQLGYPSKLIPYDNSKTSDLRTAYINDDIEGFRSIISKGTALDGKEVGFFFTDTSKFANFFKIILKVIGGNADLTKEYFSILKLDAPILRILHISAIQNMIEYIDDKDVLKSLFYPLEEKLKSLFNIEPNEVNALFLKERLEKVNGIIGDQVLVEALFRCNLSPVMMENIIVPFLSHPKFSPYIKEAASVKDNLGCTHLDRAIAEGSDITALFLLKSGVTPTWFNFYRNECGDEVYSLLKLSYARSFLPTNLEPNSYSEGIEDFARMYMESQNRKSSVKDACNSIAI